MSSFELVYGGNETSLVISELQPATTYDIYAAALIPDRLELPRVGPASATTFGGDYHAISFVFALLKII